MKTIPFYGFFYNNVWIKRHDPVLCANFGGDCMQFVYKYFDIYWIDGQEKAVGGWTQNEYQSHICTPEEITPKHYGNGHLYFCPPTDKLKL
jgi:hypothetical protein